MSWMMLGFGASGINGGDVEEIGVDDSLVDGSRGTAGSRKHLSRPG
jgi:hypothetical protein